MSYSTIAQTMTSIQNQTAQKRYEDGQSNVGSSKLDKNAFLQLLLTQLQHQDPLEPMSNEDFISQQAQFTEIEKMDDLINAFNQGNQIVQAGALVGKNVTITTENNQTINGQVQSVVVSNDGVAVKINNNTYPVGAITEVNS